MPSGALEEKKPEDEAVVEGKPEAGDDEEKEDLVEKATEEDEETPKKSSRGRKGSSKKTETPKKRGGGDSTAKKEEKEKEPVTPASERPTRERKVVERYSAPESGRSSGTKPLNIEKGSGTQLKDIPNVAFKLSKRKLDDNLQILHTILFGKKAKATVGPCNTPEPSAWNAVEKSKWSRINRRDIVKYGSLGIALSCLAFTISNWKSMQYASPKAIWNVIFGVDQPSIVQKEGESKFDRIQQFVNYISDLETKGTAPIVPEFPAS